MSIPARAKRKDKWEEKKARMLGNNYAMCSKCDDWTTLQKGSSTCDTCLRKSYWTSMTSGGASGGGVAASTHTHTAYGQFISTQNTSSPPAEFVDVDDVEVKFPLTFEEGSGYSTDVAFKVLCKYINELHEQLADLREELEELREDL